MRQPASLSTRVLAAATILLLFFFGLAFAALDVAFTEATVGAGVSTVILIATVFSTRRRSKD